MRFEFEHMPLEDAPTTMTGRVTEFEPPRLFAFYWGEDHLRFELEPGSGADTGCVLRLTVLLDAREKAARDAAGWHISLDGLERALAGGRGAGPAGGDGDWREQYAEYQRRGLPTGAPVPGE
jgi:uncharacterized protein YndB with AHSA1/START domain